MKTIGRVLIILATFVAIMGITYAVVNASSSSTSANMPAFENDDEGRQRPEGMPPQSSDGEEPGLLENTVVIAVIVALIVVPRSIRQKRIRSISASAR